MLGQTNTSEYSDQCLWLLVYTLYPFYNSETLLEVWRGDKSVDISANVVTITPREQEQTVMLFDDVQRSGANIKTQDNLSYFFK